MARIRGCKEGWEGVNTVDLGEGCEGTTKMRVFVEEGGGAGISLLRALGGNSKEEGC